MQHSARELSNDLFRTVAKIKRDGCKNVRGDWLAAWSIQSSKVCFLKDCMAVIDSSAWDGSEHEERRSWTSELQKIVHLCDVESRAAFFGGEQDGERRRVEVGRQRGQQSHKMVGQTGPCAGTDGLQCTRQSADRIRRDHPCSRRLTYV